MFNFDKALQYILIGLYRQNPRRLDRNLPVLRRKLVVPQKLRRFDLSFETLWPQDNVYE
jgi:hypothetical protein